MSTSKQEKRIITPGCYMELYEELVECQAHLEGCMEMCKAHAPEAEVRTAAVVLVNDARRLVTHIRIYSDTQEEYDKRGEEMDRRIKEDESRPHFLFECGRCHWQFFAHKHEQRWCDQCRRPLKGAARIGKPVERKSAQPGVVLHNTPLQPLFKRMREDRLNVSPLTNRP